MRIDKYIYTHLTTKYLGGDRVVGGFFVSGEHRTVINNETNTTTNNSNNGNSLQSVKIKICIFKFIYITIIYKL